ncbi:RDD family protein [Streptomyces sp. VRA16 Mangrove soil]|uniref:RDD family protein n=1 Tax=Streptomyces sp. VRA16 Mangrove soil TaxID=2817434 RepID=UPI001A9EB199|nr:RDD family protein [Streptomyces sp. VRA16 Mangrove soil]MBO1337742.1 RDD family protein [Streptomyces sp. VRA16 Mangrove soil]
MSAPTPAPGDDRPREGYYPDPSIPGYVRYWNGAAWVPGTSRPAPSDGEPLPAPAGATPAPAPAPEPVTQTVAAAEETGPVFLDEEPSVRTETGPDSGPDAPSAPEPASAWQADASRQSGFGGEQDRRVSWGSPEPAPPAAPEPAPPAAPEPATPAARTDGAVTLRAARPAANAETPPRAEGTMAIRAVPQQAAAPAPDAPEQARAHQRAGLNPQQPQANPAPAPAPAPTQPQPQQPQPSYGYPPQQQQQAQPQPSYGYPPQQQQALPTPITQGPGGGQPSWAQQVHRLAGAQEGQEGQHDGPVTPFKPVANDPFLAAAQAQANARPAGLGKRFAARIVDSVVLGAVTAAVAVPLGTRAVDHINTKIDEAKASGRQVTVWLLDGTTGTYLGIVLGVLLVFGVLYEAVPTAKWGRTLGKKLFGLSVRDMAEHDSPTFGAALKRWLAYSVPGVLAIGILGVLWGAFDRPWRQCLHDKVARTFVAG